jgi:predicted metal-dependent phosphoesterase TrpH
VRVDCHLHTAASGDSVLPLGEVIGRIRTQGGLVYVPHPFDPARSSLSKR